MPRNLDEVLERQKDIQYSSKTRFNTNRAKQLEDARARRCAGCSTSCRPRCADDPDVRAAGRCGARAQASRSCTSSIAASTHSSQSKDYEFSRATVRALWDAAATPCTRTMASPQWPHACSSARGVQTFDLALICVHAIARRNFPRQEYAR